MGMGIIADAFLGAVAGGAQASYDNELLQQKEEMQQRRDELLSRLRMKEHVEQKASDLQMARGEEKRRETETSDFYQRTALPGKQVTLPQVQSDEGDAADAPPIPNATVAQPASRREQADFRLEEARKSGKAGIIAQTYAEAKDIRAEEEQDRKIKADDKKSEIASRLAEIKEANERTRDRLADIAQQRMTAMIAGVIGGRKGDPTNLANRRFDDKQWSDAKKELSKEFVVDDPVSGKPLPDTVAQNAALSTMRTLQQAGDADPVDAAVFASGLVRKVSTAARAEAKGNSQLYEKYMSLGMQREMQKRFGGSDQAPEPPPKPAPPAPKPPGLIAATQAKSVKDPMAVKYEQEQAEMDRNERADFSEDVKSWFDSQSAKRTTSAAQDDEDVQRRMSQMDRNRRDR
jgi:hypothetical protein